MLHHNTIGTSVSRTARVSVSCYQPKIKILISFTLPIELVVMCNPSDHNARCRQNSWHHRGLSGFHKPSKLHRWTTTRKLSWGCFSNFKLITSRTRPHPPNPNFGCPCTRFVDPAFGGKASERNHQREPPKASLESCLCMLEHLHYSYKCLSYGAGTRSKIHLEEYNTYL